jgi:transposase
VGNTITTDIIIGVDTHKDVHAAATISALGVHLASTTISANSKGYQTLEAWATSLGTVRAIGIEGTGSYGAGLSRFLTEHGHTVFEVNRPHRQLRHQKGKSDVAAARAPDLIKAHDSVLHGSANARNDPIRVWVRCCGHSSGVPSPACG